MNFRAPAASCALVNLFEFFVCLSDECVSYTLILICSPSVVDLDYV
jgi:hypothetical protein